MPKEENYKEMLAQAMNIKSMAESFIETIKPYAGMQEDSPESSEDMMDDEAGDINYPEGDRKPKIALAIQFLKKKKGEE